jgi:hydrogenase maturation factor HypE
MLIITDAQNVDEIMQKIGNQEIKISLIGEVKGIDAGIKLVTSDKSSEIYPPESDELYKIVSVGE